MKAAGSEEGAVSQFLAGRAVLEAHQPETGTLLATWKGREATLLAMVVRKDPGLPEGVHGAAVEAWRIGAVLERETQAAPVQVPGALKGLEPDLQRASARLQACGLDHPFGGETLKAVPPATLRGALEEVRKGGLLTEGPEWALRRDQAPGLAEGLQKRLEVERPFPDLMMGQGRGA
jgi:hypothetical protein